MNTEMPMLFSRGEGTCFKSETDFVRLINSGGVAANGTNF